MPHAIARAMERYGIKITTQDLLDLCEECIKGYGRVVRLPDGRERHILMCKGKAVVVVYAPCDGVNVFDSRGRILTVLPKTAVLSGKSRSPATGVHKRRARPGKKRPLKSR